MNPDPALLHFLEHCRERSSWTLFDDDRELCSTENVGSRVWANPSGFHVNVNGRCGWRTFSSRCGTKLYNSRVRNIRLEQVSGLRISSIRARLLPVWFGEINRGPEIFSLSH